MTWFEDRAGRKVHAAEGSGLAEVYGHRYKVLGADELVALVVEVDPPALGPQTEAEARQAILDETPPEAKTKRTRTRTRKTTAEK